MKIRVILMMLFGILIYSISFSQTVIKMKREGGVSILPCKVNGLELNFIFDTGASEVSISMTEATFMLKNGFLSKSDIIGTGSYLDAVGNINVGIGINLNSIEIAGLKLLNVKATVVQNNNAPLLLGQSAISKLGKVEIDLEANTLTILSGNNSYDFSKEKIVNNEPLKVGNLEVWSKDLGAMNWSDAYKACKSLGNKWRLPSTAELSFLFQNKNKLRSFSGGSYWSSSEMGNYFALAFFFDNGKDIVLDKDKNANVFAVRDL